MNEILFIAGLSLSVGVFALKAGLGASAGGFRGWKLALIISIYLGLFAGVGLAVRYIRLEQMSASLGPILRGGIWAIVFMALGMAVWGWLMLRKGSAGVAGKLSWLVVSPCPVCVFAVFFSVAAAATMSSLSPVWISAILAAGFSTVLFLVYTFARQISMSADALGLIFLFVSGYFLTSLAVAPAYARASEIYVLSEQFSHGSDARVRDLLCLAILTAGIFVSGLWRGVRK